MKTVTNHTNILKEIGSELSRIGKLTDSGAEFDVSFTSDLAKGDISSNIALRHFKQMGFSSPMEAALKIAEEYTQMDDPCIEKVEAAKPGFINFWLSRSYLEDKLHSILKEKEDFGKSNHAKGFKVMVEFTDPNPLKEFHIGHLYSNTVGESLARLFEASGADVWRVCYQGDVGLHVAKALFGIVNHKLRIEDVEEEPLSSRAKFLGEAYALGAKEYEENNNSKSEIENINKKVYAKDPEIYPVYKKAKQWSLEYFETIYKRLGTKFNKYYFESEAGERGIKIVKENMGKVFAHDQGAVIFPQDVSGLHTRVFINSLGLPTYEAKELGLAPQKYEDFSYDLSVIITGNEINEYFKVLLKALSLIYPELSKKTHHIGHGMVRLPSGKMSSRTGDVITAETMLQEVKTNLKKAHAQMSDDVVEALTVGAVKYAFLKPHVGADIVFNLEESISIQGNSGPYIQYTFARTQSVIQKRHSERSEESSSDGVLLRQPADQDDNLEIEEVLLLRLLIHFPEVVSTTAEKYAPNLIVNYLFDLASLFNIFYEKHRIIGSDRETFRLGLTEGVGQVLKNGLNLLGIPAPERV